MSDFSSDEPARRGHDLFASSEGDEPASSRNQFEDLPPVEPPSAGFIVQLFLIPMLIVGAIIGVYALFGRLAVGEQDWRELVTELRSPNEHRRWRAAMGMTYLLQANQDRGAKGRELAENPEIAKALLELLTEQLAKPSPRPEDVRHQTYLVKALGFLDPPARVVPALQQALLAKNGYDQEVRNAALVSISSIAQRTSERAKEENRPLLLEELVEIPSLVDDVMAVSEEAEPLSRKVGAFVLGLLPSAASAQRLEVLLGDSDRDVRVNAAIGLARQSSTAGWPVFQAVLKDAQANPAEQAGMDLVILTNVIKAIEGLSGTWTADQKQELVSLLESIAEKHAEVRVRTDAKKTLQTLNGTK